MSDLFSSRALNAKKSSSRYRPQEHFLLQEAESSLFERLKVLKLKHEDLKTLNLGERSAPQTCKPLMPSCIQRDLPYDTDAYDIVLDLFSLHWVNDIPRYLQEIKRILNARGVYLTGFLGEKTLQELRASMIDIDLSLFEGAFNRVSPFLKIQSIPDLFKNLGFHNTVVDHEEIQVIYQDIYHLIRDLRMMGETKSFVGKENKILFHRAYFQNLDLLLKKEFPGPKGGIKITFDLAYVCAAQAYFPNRDQ